MSSRESGRSASSVYGFDRLTIAQLKKEFQPISPIGGILRPPAASSAHAGPFTKYNRLDWAHLVTANAADLNASGAHRSTKIGEYITSSSEYHGPTLSQAEKSS